MQVCGRCSTITPARRRKRRATTCCAPRATPRLAPWSTCSAASSRRIAGSARKCWTHIEKVIGAKGKPWTKGSKLPGGEFPPREFEAQVEKLNELYPEPRRPAAAPPGPAIRHPRRDPARRAKRIEELGEIFGADLTQREVDYLVDNEWARTADDILWRRTKLGLRIGLADKARLDAYLERRLNKGKK